MTVASEVGRSGPYNGNGVTTVFDFTFKIVNAAHLQVIRDIGGVETTLALGTNYTVAGVGGDSGSVTIPVAPAAGQKITILRKVPFTQEMDLENQGAYYAETVEAAFDLSVARDQQMMERLNRAVVVSASSDPSILAGLVLDILRLGESADEVDTVANNIARVITVANNIANVNVVGGISSAVTAVAGIASAVTAVAGNAADISTVADNLADVTNFSDVYYGPSATKPTTRRDGSALIDGDLYFDTTFDRLRVFDGGDWRETGAQALTMKAASFVGTGAAVNFTLPVEAGSAANVLLWIGGQRQVPVEDYTVSGSTLTFTFAPGYLQSFDVLCIGTLSRLEISDQRTFNSRAEVVARTIPIEVSAINVLGRAAAGDGEGGVYKRVSSGGDLVSGDGGLWEIVAGAVVNAGSALPAVVRALGEDANIDLFLQAKGTGHVRLSKSAVAGGDAAITGYIEVKDATGAIVKLAKIA